jgi:hypothetical protein
MVSFFRSLYQAYWVPWWLAHGVLGRWCCAWVLVAFISPTARIATPRVMLAPTTSVRCELMRPWSTPTASSPASVLWFTVMANRASSRATSVGQSGAGLLRPRAPPDMVAFPKRRLWGIDSLARCGLRRRSLRQRLVRMWCCCCRGLWVLPSQPLYLEYTGSFIVHSQPGSRSLFVSTSLR